MLFDVRADRRFVQALEVGLASLPHRILLIAVFDLNTLATRILLYTMFRSMSD